MAEQVPRSTHKFGGASVKDAAAIRRVGQLLSNHLRPEEQAVVVVSPVIRRPLSEIVRQHIDDIIILSFNELPDGRKVDVVATINGETEEES